MPSDRKRLLRKRKNSDTDIVHIVTIAILKTFIFPTIISEVSINFIFRPQDTTKFMEQNKRQEGKWRVLPCHKRLKYLQQKSSFQYLISHSASFRKLPGRHFPAVITDRSERNKADENTTHFHTNTFQLSKLTCNTHNKMYPFYVCISR